MFKCKPIQYIYTFNLNICIIYPYFKLHLTTIFTTTTKHISLCFLSYYGESVKNPE